MELDVFISYSFDNKEVADAVCHGLESSGIRCWYAPRDIIVGENWMASVVHAIKSAKIMVVIFTEESNQSQHVLNELSNAVKANVIIIPFKLSKVEPSDGMQYYLSSRHWLDAIDKPLEDSIAQLIRQINLLLKRTAEDDTPDDFPENSEKHKPIENFEADALPENLTNSRSKKILPKRHLEFQIIAEKKEFF